MVITAVPAQRDLFTKRYRRIPALDPSETQIQVSLVARLKWQCRPGVTFFHCPNGEVRDKRVAAKLKAMGVLPGVADLLFFWAAADGRPAGLFLELKRRFGGLSPDQETFGRAMKEIGFSFEWTDQLDEAVRILVAYAILPNERGHFCAIK
jgi:hypothetical protein